MKFLLLLVSLTFLTTSVFAKSELEVNGNDVTISGSAAKELYDGLKTTAKNNPDSGAGPSVYFKKNKTFRCFVDKDTKYYACNIDLAK